MNFAHRDKRDIIEKLLSQKGLVSQKSELVFSFAGENEAYFKTDVIPDEADLKELKRQISEKTGIEIYIVEQ